ncbi:I78 family peptidase inhibitor [Kushneria sp. EE4]
MKHSLLTALATTVLLGLGGCAWFGGGSDDAATSPADTDAVAANDAAPDEAQKACGADRLKALTGARLDQNVRQHIVDQSQARQFRVLAPDTMHTMDYHEDRLNIRVNEQGVIQSFGCG